MLRLAGVPCIVMGFCESGELGFALFHSRADTLKLYGALMREGERFGIANFGVKTHNTLRMEKGIPKDESEYCLDFTAVEVSLAPSGYQASLAGQRQRLKFGGSLKRVSDSPVSGRPHGLLGNQAVAFPSHRLPLANQN